MSDTGYVNQDQAPANPQRYAVVVRAGTDMRIVRSADELPAVLKAMRDLPTGSYDIVLFSKLGVTIREPARQPRAVVDLKGATTFGKPRKPRDPNAPKRASGKNGKGK